MAVLGHPDGFEMVDPVAAPDLREDDILLGHAVGGNQNPNRLANQFRPAVAEQSLGGRVARLDDAVEILGDDCIVG